MRSKIINLILILSILSATSLMAMFKETETLLSEAKREVGEMTPQKLKKMIDNEESVIILDIREREQRAEGQIYADDSYAITRCNLEFHTMKKIKNKNAVIVTYCRGGIRSAFAAQTLRKLGYKNATSLKGGLKAWAKAGYVLETGLGETRLIKAE
ncbi:rhodanese-like domain-containing protein [Sulfurimonas sp.]|uniref:rhodanese-like domain-containing protein n=1 Tax=Sulfurimonas sp. TaxID=2022749 RepID=UPI003562DF91